MLEKMSSRPIYLLRLIAEEEGWSPEELLSALDPNASLPEPTAEGTCMACGEVGPLVVKRLPKFVDHYYLHRAGGRRPVMGSDYSIEVCPYCAVNFSGSRNPLTTSRYILLATKKVTDSEEDRGIRTTILLTNSREEFSGALKGIFGVRAFYFASVRVGGALSRDYPLLKARSIRMGGDLVWVWVGPSEVPLRREDVDPFLERIGEVV